MSIAYWGQLLSESVPSCEGKQNTGIWATWTHTPVPLCPKELHCCDLVFQDSPLTHQGIYTCVSFLEKQKYLLWQCGNSLIKSAFPSWGPGMKQVCITRHMLCLQLEANPKTGIWVGGGDLGGGKSPSQGRTWPPPPTKSPWFGLELPFSRNRSLLYCKWFDDIMVTFTSDLFQMIPWFWNPESLPSSNGTHSLGFLLSDHRSELLQAGPPWAGSGPGYSADSLRGPPPQSLFHYWKRRGLIPLLQGIESMHYWHSELEYSL